MQQSSKQFSIKEILSKHQLYIWTDIYCHKCAKQVETIKIDAFTNDRILIQDSVGIYESFSDIVCPECKLSVLKDGKLLTERGLI